MWHIEPIKASDQNIQQDLDLLGADDKGEGKGEASSSFEVLSVFKMATGAVLLYSELHASHPNLLHVVF